eukprot:219372-Chlamydomonas_euryale.AAC.1
MAEAAQKLLSGPEDNVAELKTLLALASNPDPTIARLSMLSLSAVFKDILPGYRIRLPTEAELAVRQHAGTGERREGLETAENVFWGWGRFWDCRESFWGRGERKLLGAGGGFGTVEKRVGGIGDVDVDEPA